MARIAFDKVRADLKNGDEVRVSIDFGYVTGEAHAVTNGYDMSAFYLRTEAGDLGVFATNEQETIYITPVAAPIPALPIKTGAIIKVNNSWVPLIRVNKYSGDVEWQHINESGITGSVRTNEWVIEELTRDSSDFKILFEGIDF